MRFRFLAGQGICHDVGAVVEDSGQSWGQGARREPVPALLAAHAWPTRGSKCPACGEVARTGGWEVAVKHPGFTIFLPQRCVKPELASHSGLFSETRIARLRSQIHWIRGGVRICPPHWRCCTCGLPPGAPISFPSENAGEHSGTLQSYKAEMCGLQTIDFTPSYPKISNLGKIKMCPLLIEALSSLPASLCDDYLGFP